MSTVIGRINGHGKSVYTTREAAVLCGLSEATIERCFDNGKLRGYREGGTGLRRIPRKELLRFMKLCGYR